MPTLTFYELFRKLAPPMSVARASAYTLRLVCRALTGPDNPTPFYYGNNLRSSPCGVCTLRTSSTLSPLRGQRAHIHFTEKNRIPHIIQGCANTHRRLLCYLQRPIIPSSTLSISGHALNIDPKRVPHDSGRTFLLIRLGTC